MTINYDMILKKKKYFSFIKFEYFLKSLYRALFSKGDKLSLKLTQTIQPS